MMLTCRLTGACSSQRRKPDPGVEPEALQSCVPTLKLGCPRQESNLCTRFRKPLLYPLSYGGLRLGRPSHCNPRGRAQPDGCRCRDRRSVGSLTAMDTERARALLARERERIERGLRGAAPEYSDEPTTTDAHLADQASDLYDAEFDEGLSEDLRAELAAVERAEQRLADGKYGFSIESGDPIPDERLEAVPTAERTVEEQARFDRGG